MTIRGWKIAAAVAALWAGTAIHGPAAAQDRTDTVIDEVAAFERDVADAIDTEAVARKDGTYLRGRARSIRSFFNKISRDGVSLAEAQLVRDRIKFLRTRYNLGVENAQ